MHLTDVTILTDKRYVDPVKRNDYIDNILEEDGLVKNALEAKGLSVQRRSWDDPKMDWNSTKYAIFRTTWDYFDRFEAFNQWLEKVKDQTRLINSYDLIRWNINKSYLFKIEEKGIPIPPSIFIEIGEQRTLSEIVHESGWEKIILKPAIAGAARHTYFFERNSAGQYEAIFRTLIRVEDMILQEYQESITEKGELSLMVFGGKYSHSVLKKAREGDFRVQDDFGGTVHAYKANEEEINLALSALKACPEEPVYGRVDLMYDNSGKLCISELELIEPELWFRMDTVAAISLADAFIKKISRDGL